MTNPIRTEAQSGGGEPAGCPKVQPVTCRCGCPIFVRGNGTIVPHWNDPDLHGDQEKCHMNDKLWCDCHLHDKQVCDVCQLKSHPEPPVERRHARIDCSKDPEKYGEIVCGEFNCDSCYPEPPVEEQATYADGYAAGRRDEALDNKNYPVLGAEPKAEDTPNEQSEAKATLTTEGRTGSAYVPTGTSLEEQAMEVPPKSNPFPVGSESWGVWMDGWQNGREFGRSAALREIAQLKDALKNIVTGHQLVDAVYAKSDNQRPFNTFTAQDVKHIYRCLNPDPDKLSQLSAPDLWPVAIVSDDLVESACIPSRHDWVSMMAHELKAYRALRGKQEAK